MPCLVRKRFHQHAPPLVEQIQPLAFWVALTVAFIREVVRYPGKRIDRVEVLSEPFRNERRADREVLVVRTGQPLAVLIRAIERPDFPGCERGSDGLRERAGSMSCCCTHFAM